MVRNMVLFHCITLIIFPKGAFFQSVKMICGLFNSKYNLMIRLCAIKLLLAHFVTQMLSIVCSKINITKDVNISITLVYNFN